MNRIAIGVTILFLALICTSPACRTPEGSRAWSTWTPPADLSELPVVEGLPDLLVMSDGRPIRTPKEWAQRREEMKAMIQYYEYGHLPPRPDQVTAASVEVKDDPSGRGTVETMTLEIDSQKRLSLGVALYRPNSAPPYPVLIREEAHLVRTPSVPLFLEHGFAVVVYAREDLDPDKNNVVGPAQRAYPEYDWATLAVWAWGAMRVVDYLESRDDIDLGKIMINGHSRGGKVALLAGALDERFALVCPNGSGAGGAGSFRIEGKGCESLEAITDPKRFSYWFHPRLRWFAGREDRLPFDQHFLKALVAPRTLLCTDSLDDLWANPLGTQATSIAAQRAFALFNATEKNGLHFRHGPHDSTPKDWQALLEFAEWHLLGETPRDKSRFWQTPFDE